MMSFKPTVLLLICIGGVATTRVQKRSDDVSAGAMEVEISHLASQVTSLTAELIALKNQVTSHQTKIDTLEKTVAFSATGGANPVTATEHGPILISRVQLNVGNAFDPQTGFFTAPVSGVYQFNAAFMTASRSSHREVWADIVANGQVAAHAISDSRHGYYDDTDMQAVVHVSAGKKVYVRNASSSSASFYGGTYLAFSGFLLRAD